MVKNTHFGLTKVNKRVITRNLLNKTYRDTLKRISRYYIHLFKSHNEVRNEHDWLTGRRVDMVILIKPLKGSNLKQM